MNPLAICIAVGPQESFESVRITLDSVVDQTVPDVSVVVKTFGSHLFDEINSYGDEHLAGRLELLAGDDKGIYDAFNTCASNADAEHVQFLGCGDELADSFVAEDLIAQLRTSTAVAHYGVVLLASSDGRIVSTFDNSCFLGTRLLLPWRNPCHSQGLIYRRSWLLEHPFPIDVGPLADLVHTHRHGLRIHAAWVGRPMAIFRAGGASNVRTRRALRARMRGLMANCDNFRPAWFWRLATYVVGHLDHFRHSLSQASANAKT